MTLVAPVHSGPYTMYEWPVIQPMSAVHHQMSPVLVVEDVLERRRGKDHVPAGRVQHALGLAGRTGGVEDEQRIFRVQPHRFALGVRFVHRFVPPHVAARLHRHVQAGAFHDHDRS